MITVAVIAPDVSKGRRPSRRKHKYHLTCSELEMDRNYCRKSTRELGRTSIYNLRRNLRERDNDNGAEQQREINIEAQAAE